MKLRTKLLYMAAFLMLIVPLMLTGNASAVVYNPDGAVLNGTTGLWELPNLTAIEGCYDGTTTINPAATKFACRNVDVTSLTTASACAATGVTPAGWNATASVARWSSCSNGGYTANSTDPAADCATNGGTTTVFARCNRSLAPADCNATNLPGFTWATAGTSASSYTCSTTGMNVAACTGYTATFGSTTVVGSAAYNIGTGVTTCTAYISDATSCSAAGGTISTANTDETRGFCGGNWVFKAGASNNGYTDMGSSVRNNCLKCHNPAYMDGATPSPAGAVAKYINASHKNASRKIVAGSKLANVYLDSNGVEQFGIFPYLPAGAAQTDGPLGSATTYNLRKVDWVNGKIEDTTNAGPGWVGLKNLPTGVYTQWYWEFGYYGEDPERGVYNGAVGSNGKPSAKQPACFACHATNFEGSATVDATKEPAKSYPLGIHWDGTTTYAPGTRPGVVNFITGMTDRATNVKTTTTYGKWDEFGIVCSRCHNSAGGSHTSGGTGAANPTTAYTVNAVCGQCHVRASSSDYSVTAGTGVLTTRAQVGTGHPNYHETDFLNSPHARFTGTYGQITSSASYNSTFMTTQAGCVGCHNPHGSVREPLIELTEGTSAAPAEGIENKCADCHTDKSLDNMMHPTTPGTPASEPDGCAFCHMPNGRHLFRITTDANYTMTQPTAFSPKPDGTFNEAVWVDLQSACGQCHGGGIGSTGATHNGAPYMSRSYLASVAGNMHLAAPAAAPTAVITSVTPTGYTASLVDGSTAGSAITVNWGDGTTSTGSAGDTLTHTYATAGTFNIMDTAEKGGLYGSTTSSVSVPTTADIVVNISAGVSTPATLPITTDAKFILKKNGVTKKVEYGTAIGTFVNRKAGTYKVKMYKKGYTFDCDAVAAGNQNPVTVINGSTGAIVNCTYTKP